MKTIIISIIFIELILSKRNCDCTIQAINQYYIAKAITMQYLIH